MKKTLRNLLISIGPGYHPSVRLLHSMVKDKSDCKILILNLEKDSPINKDLRIDYSIEYSEFKKAFDLLKNWLAKNRFDLIGISFMSHYWDIFVKITGTIREILPHCKIIAGGVHAWHINPLETLSYCDYVCAGEGEKVYFSLVEALSLKGNTSLPLRIPGLMEKNSQEIIHTPAKGLFPMDKLPMPTWGSKEMYYLGLRRDKLTFINEDPYVGIPYGCIHIGRGCPYACTFCINNLTQIREIRIRSVDKVIEELKALCSVKKTKAILFMDEVFPMKQAWLEEFAYKYRETITLPFVITTFPGTLTHAKAKLLKSAGLKEVSIGIQTGSERVRKNIYNRPGKNNTILEENAVLSGLNITAYYDFIIRNPFESEEDYRMSLDLVRNLKHPFYLKFHTLAYYPKHTITKMALAKNLISQDKVSATTGYLDVTTPHKIAVVEHYSRENQLVVWHAKLKEEALKGSRESLYYLLMSYYGFWYIPRVILDSVARQFMVKRVWPVHILIFLAHITLIVRNNFLVKKLYLVVFSYREKGFWTTIKKIIKRLSNTQFDKTIIPV